MKKQVNNIFIRIMSVIAAFLLAVTLVPMGNVHAAGKIDVSKEGTLTVVHYTVDDEVVSGVNSRIYQIASVDEDGVYTKVSPFDNDEAFPKDINEITKQEEWDECLKPAREYITDHDVKAYASGTSDGKGKTIYSNLDLGIYLVLSDSIKIGNYKHSFTDFFVAVPNLEKDHDGNYYYNYDVVASPKRTRVDVTEIKEYTVRKRWNDSGYESKRPTSISVEIYCDDELYKNVTLDSSNNWSYSWKYEAGHEWKLKEITTGNNYTATYTTDGYEFIITNTYNPPSPPPTPDEPTPTDPIPDLPEVLGAIRDLPAVLGARRLPQTGQLWWPLPILVIAGIVLIVKGIRKNRYAHEG